MYKTISQCIDHSINYTPILILLIILYVILEIGIYYSGQGKKILDGVHKIVTGTGAVYGIYRGINSSSNDSNKDEDKDKDSKKDSTKDNKDTNDNANKDENKTN